MSTIESTGMGSIQRHPPKDLFSRTDSDRSGGVSQAELEKLSDKIQEKTGTTIDAGDEALNSYDSDGNGLLSGEELKTVLDNSGFGPSRGMQGMAPPPPSLQQATDSYNSNNSDSGQNALSALVTKLQALLDTLSGNSGQSQDSPPEDVFGKVDTDRSGSLSKDELRVLAENIKKTTGQTLDVSDEAIIAADKNGDGEITPDEVDLRSVLSLQSANMKEDSSAKELKTALDQNWVQGQQATTGTQQDHPLSSKHYAETDSGIVQNQIAELKKLLETLSKYYAFSDNGSDSNFSMLS